MAPRMELVMKLPHLQNLVKRDPAAYKEEFTQQLRAYQAEAKVYVCVQTCVCMVMKQKGRKEGLKDWALIGWSPITNTHVHIQLFTMRPSRDSPRFLELLHFMSHVASCYPEARDCVCLFMRLYVKQKRCLCESVVAAPRPPPYTYTPKSITGVRRPPSTTGVLVGGLRHRDDAPHAQGHGQRPYPPQTPGDAAAAHVVALGLPLVCGAGQRWVCMDRYGVACTQDRTKSQRLSAGRSMLILSLHSRLNGLTEMLTVSPTPN